MVTFKELIEQKKSIGIMGLGYVGLPLAIEFAKKFSIIGFDINEKRIEELKSGNDLTRETEKDELQHTAVKFTNDPEALKQCSIIIIAVPTPIDKHRNPDLGPVISASKTAGQNMRKGVIVVYESTVYPGLTEEICVPILEKESGLKFNADFTVGYSPERINPGDKIHTLTTVKKIVSGSTPETAELLAEVYGEIITAGIHRASSIRVAEAAKVIENTQRDVNIALMNELSLIFERLGIDTQEVLQAAGSKWNFLSFTPGLVGGHCIGVDPYYLTYKAEELGFHPEVILAGRRINDRMGKYVAEKTIKRLIMQGRKIDGSRIGVLGLTFKENVPDLRNTRVIDLIEELKSYGAQVLVHDSEASAQEALKEYGVNLLSLKELNNLDAVIVAVPHNFYKKLTPNDFKKFFEHPDSAIFIDVKGIFSSNDFKNAGFDYWRL